MAERIDGMAMRAAILDETRAEAARLLEKHGRKPGLATILVGDNPASVSYVSLKVKTALALGFHEIQDNQSARRRCSRALRRTTGIRPCTASSCNCPCPRTSMKAG